MRTGVVWRTAKVAATLGVVTTACTALTSIDDLIVDPPGSVPVEVVDAAETLDALPPPPERDADPVIADATADASDSAPPPRPPCKDAGGDAGECSSSCLPDTLRLTVSGFTSCTCLNGTFTLTRASANDSMWSSPAINGCPDQEIPAYIKLVLGSFDLGVTNQSGTPGYGNSNLSRAKSVACSPLAVQGEASVAGNIGSYCSATAEANKMKWTVVE